MIDASLIASLLPAVLALGSAAGGVRFVQESQRGVKLRFGKVIRNRDSSPRIYEPGFVWALPTVHSLRRIHVRTQTLTLRPQQVKLADHTVFTVGALVITRVVDEVDAIYRSLFEVDDVYSSVEEFCASALRDVLVGIDYPALDDPEQLAARVRERVEPRLSEWGVRVDDFKLTECSPSAETARMILVRTEAQLRAEALNVAANALASGAKRLHPTLAAALVGMPVSVALSPPEGDDRGWGGQSEPSQSVSIQLGGKRIVSDESGAESGYRTALRPRGA